jgi:hypothetical protein
MPATKKPDVQRYSFGTQRPDRDEHGEWASAVEHARVVAQRDELVTLLAFFLECYESEHGWSGETDVPDEVRDARAAPAKAKE